MLGFGTATEADDLLDAAAQLGTRDWLSVDPTGYWAGGIDQNVEVATWLRAGAAATETARRTHLCAGEASPKLGQRSRVCAPLAVAGRGFRACLVRAIGRILAGRCLRRGHDGVPAVTRGG